MKLWMTILIPLLCLAYFVWRSDAGGCVWSILGLFVGIVIFLVMTPIKR